MNRIYLDHAATTPLLPEARAAMEPWLGRAANPSSLHAEGRLARDAVDQARETLATALGCLFGEIVFTASGTEAANLAILGVALANKDKGRNRVLLGAAEHHCVLHTAPFLQRLGYVVELVPVDKEARVSPSVFDQMVNDDVLLVSVMQANNELGSVNPVRELASLATSAGVLFHCDAAQTFPWGGTVDDLGADLLSVSAHKLYGPTGAGALYVRSGTDVQPITVGGGQEREMRAGTENVAAIVGFAEAVRWCREHPGIQEVKRAARNAFADKLVSSGFVPSLPFVAGNDSLPSALDTLPGHFHCRYAGIDADTFLIRLDRNGVSASSGAACSSGSLEASHVLLACGYSNSEAVEGLRYTFGRDNTVEEALEAAERVVQTANEIMMTRPGRGDR